MEITELRIGNILNMQVTEGWNMRALKVNEFLAVYKNPEWVNPIPLSEEILLKIGFEYCDYKSEWLMKLNISASTLYCRSNKDKFYWQFNETYLSNMIDSVHKLQNFTYTFGKELNTTGLI